MKEVLISIQPKWCELIANGTKTVEVRKTKPKLNTPFKCYIYCTKSSKKYQTVANHMVLNDDELSKLPNGKIKYGNSIELMGYDDYSKDNFLNGKVIGEFICERIKKFRADNGIQTYYNALIKDTCLSDTEIIKYANGKPLYGWHISDLVIYDKPKELNEFSKHDNSYDNAFGWAFDDKLKNVKITRPPQSWCYVEEVKE